MEDLPHLLKHNPNTQTINLEFSEIDSLDPLLPWLIQFPRLKELLLFGNRIETLPRDLSKLKTLEKLDISNNLIDSVASIIPGLVSLPRLIELHITIQSVEEEQLIIEKIQNLENLNGSILEKASKMTSEDFVDELQSVHASLLPCQSSGFFNDPVSLDQEYLERIAGIYDEVRSLWVKEDKTKDSKLANDFDECLRTVMKDLSEVLKEDQQEFLINVYSMKGKFELALLCQNKLLDLVQRKNEKLGKIAKEVNQTLLGVFSEAFRGLLAIQPKVQKKMQVLKNEVLRSQEESSEVIEAADQLQKEAKSLKDSRENLIKMFHQERLELQAEIESLQEENKKYLDTIIRHSKSYADGVIASRSYDESREETDKKYSASVSYSRSLGKILSLRQLKEVIEDLYSSKVKFDERCADGKLPRETMEQHMYNYLNKKYGLKNLVADWAASIINSIKKYSIEDNDVAVFGLILKNEIEEEFRFVQLQLKKTVNELLKVNLRTKFPLKSNANVADMVQERISGYLNEDEWVDIIKFMYNEQDSLEIIDEIYQLRPETSFEIAPKTRISREELNLLKEKEKSLKNRISYAELVNSLLDFQMRGHQKYLEKFVKLFKKSDGNNDGIINENELRRLINGFGLGFREEDCRRILQIIDPFDNQQISFSECVSLFANEPVPGNNHSVLERLSVEEDI